MVVDEFRRWCQIERNKRYSQMMASSCEHIDLIRFSCLIKFVSRVLNRIDKNVILLKSCQINA